MTAGPVAEALLRERLGYVRRGLADRIALVDAELLLQFGVHPVDPAPPTPLVFSLMRSGQVQPETATPPPAETATPSPATRETATPAKRETAARAPRRRRAA